MATTPPDPVDRPELLRLATAILNGEAVDWSAVDSTTPAQMRSLVTQLRTLAAVTEFYRSLPAEAALASTPVGEMWGHLRIDERIGAGAFGQVFRAWDTRLDRQVALKLLQPHAWPDADTSSGIVAEGRLLARVRHPNVVTVYGAERIGQQIGLWMELVHGRTLAEQVRSSGPLPPAGVMAIGRDLCGALQAVHDAGLIHGDVKAQNVVREAGGRVVLMDFGAGAELWAGAMAGFAAAGTPLYAAPEVLRGSSVSPQSDIYSLGVLLFYLLTGEFPVQGASLAELKAAHEKGARPLPASTPRALGRIVERCLAREPERRPASAAAIGEALDRAMSRRPRIWMAAAVTTIVIAAAAGLLGRALASRSPAGGAVQGATFTGVQRLPAPDYLLIGRPSFDGTRLPYSEIEGHPALVDLATLQPQRILTAPQGQMMFESALSPDGLQLAYVSSLPDDGYELRLTAIDSPGPRTLIPARPSEYPVPLQWARDMSQILVLFWRPDGIRDLTLISTNDGGQRVLRRFPAAVPFEASLSPDSRFVAFDFPPQPDARTRDVYILNVGDGTVAALAPHPANDVFPAWTPDGSALFFSSDRSGAMEGWLQPVADGRATDAPRAVARNMGRISPLGFTQDGTYYYMSRVGQIDAFTAPWDDAGRVGSATRLPSRVEGASAQPAWSPDGMRLAYIDLRGPVSGDRGAYVLVVRDLESGAERDLAQELKFFLPAPKWSRDGSEILIRGTDRREATSFFRVNTTTGVATPTVPNAPAGAFGWSSDGREVLYVNSQKGLLAHRIDDDTQRTVLAAAASGVAFIHRFGQSPAGGTIAFSGVATGSGVAAGSGWSLVQLLHGSTVKTLVKGGPGERLTFQCWTPDGRYVLFTRHTVAAVTEPHELWMASVDGADVRSTGFTIAGHTQANAVVMHPHGTEIAFTGGEQRWELWRMANFLGEGTGTKGFGQ